MKPKVLCISRDALTEQSIPPSVQGIFPFNLDKVSSEDFHFINRKIVDSDKELYKNMAYYFPQILPYIAVTDGNGKYLSYSRNGTETRLHGSRSIGVGGHVDITDMYDTEYNLVNNILETITQSTLRELEEEANIVYDSASPNVITHICNKVIVDTSNPVGKVHVGIFTTLVYPHAQPQEELHDAKWLTVDELKASIDEYENWSKLIIEGL